MDRSVGGDQAGREHDSVDDEHRRRSVTNERQVDAICWSAIESRRRRAC